LYYIEKEKGVMKDLKENLFKDITLLSGYIGERNIYNYDNLNKAAAFIVQEFEEAGYNPLQQEYTAKGKKFWNIIAEKKGEVNPDEVIILGAHYDTHKGSPGANDNGSGIASMLSIARDAEQYNFNRTIRFAAFTNEEKPFTRSGKMGSFVYAKECRKKKEDIKGMIALETIGYISEKKRSQKLSLSGLVMPEKGDFIAFLGTKKFKDFLEKALSSFNGFSGIHAEKKLVPRYFPGGWSSDHWSFWKKKYPAIMITDTAPLRYPWYHKAADSVDKVNYDFLSELTSGIAAMIRRLANSY
jgi:Zn-dependent M28 family amino/carboxypeptidase